MVNDGDTIDSSELALGDTILYSAENMDESENAILPSEQKEETSHLQNFELSMELESDHATSQFVQAKETPK